MNEPKAAHASGGCGGTNFVAIFKKIAAWGVDSRSNDLFGLDRGTFKP
jgi:hypothetical protein